MSELDTVLGKNPLHKHLEYSILKIEEAFKKKLLKGKKRDEKVVFNDGSYKLELSYNNHSVWLSLYFEHDFILYYAYSPLSDNYRVVTCNVKILDKMYQVDIKKSKIHQQYILKLRKLAFQMETEIKREDKLYQKEQNQKNIGTLDLLKRSNMCNLFKEKKEPVS